jgi:hypothetical protein
MRGIGNLVFVLFIALTALIAGSISHEEIHKEIFELGGCTSIQIHYFAMFDENPGFMSTSANCLDSAYQKEVWLAHMINEIVGYTFIPFFSFLAGVLAIIIRK